MSVPPHASLAGLRSAALLHSGASLCGRPDEALAECAGEAWRFRHQGVWVQHVLVSTVPAQSQQDMQETDVTALVVTVTRTWRHHWRWPVGTANEGWMRWRRLIPAPLTWICEDQDRRMLLGMVVEPKSSLPLDLTARLEVFEEGCAVPVAHLALAIVLGWYLALVARLQERAWEGMG